MRYIYHYIIVGVPVQVPHSRENSVPPTVQATHGTNIPSIEVSSIILINNLYIYIHNNYYNKLKYRKNK